MNMNKVQNWSREKSVKAEVQYTQVRCSKPTVNK